MPFITVHHPDLPNSTHQMDEFAFEKVWKVKGWKEGEFKASAKKKAAASEEPAEETSEESTTDSDT